MIKKMVIFFIFFLNLYAFNVIYGGIKNLGKPVFCGREGKMYKITEPDMWEEIVKKAKEVNETYFYSLIRKSINKAFIVNNNLPYCKSFKIVKYEPIYTLQRNIYVNGRLLYKKGYSFNILERLNQTMRSIKPLLYFGSLDNNVSKLIGIKLIKNYKNAIFLVLKGNLKKLAYQNPYKVAKANYNILNKFKITCNSTVAVLGNKYVYLIEIPINKFKKKDFDRLFHIIKIKYKDFYNEIQ